MGHAHDTLPGWRRRRVCAAGVLATLPPGRRAGASGRVQGRVEASRIRRCRRCCRCTSSSYCSVVRRFAVVAERRRGGNRVPYASRATWGFPTGQAQPQAEGVTSVARRRWPAAQAASASSARTVWSRSLMAGKVRGPAWRSRSRDRRAAPSAPGRAAAPTAAASRRCGGHRRPQCRPGPLGQRAQPLGQVQPGRLGDEPLVELAPTIRQACVSRSTRRDGQVRARLAARIRWWDWSPPGTGLGDARPGRRPYPAMTRDPAGPR